MRLLWYLTALTVYLVTLPTADAAPRPESFWKKVEHVGQRIRDAGKSALPAVKVLWHAKDVDLKDLVKVIVVMKELEDRSN